MNRGKTRVESRSPYRRPSPPKASQSTPVPATPETTPSPARQTTDLLARLCERGTRCSQSEAATVIDAFGLDASTLAEVGPLLSFSPLKLTTFRHDSFRTEPLVLTAVTALDINPPRTPSPEPIEVEEEIHSPIPVDEDSSSCSSSSSSSKDDDEQDSDEVSSEEDEGFLSGDEAIPAGDLVEMEVDVIVGVVHVASREKADKTFSRLIDQRNGEQQDVPAWLLKQVEKRKQPKQHSPGTETKKVTTQKTADEIANHKTWRAFQAITAEPPIPVSLNTALKVPLPILVYPSSDQLPPDLADFDSIQVHKELLFRTMTEEGAMFESLPRYEWLQLLWGDSWEDIYRARQPCEEMEEHPWLESRRSPYDYIDGIDRDDGKKRPYFYGDSIEFGTEDQVDCFIEALKLRTAQFVEKGRGESLFTMISMLESQPREYFVGRLFYLYIGEAGHGRLWYAHTFRGLEHVYGTSYHAAILHVVAFVQNKFATNVLYPLKYYISILAHDPEGLSKAASLPMEALLITLYGTSIASGGCNAAGGGGGMPRAVSIPKRREDCDDVSIEAFLVGSSYSSTTLILFSNLVLRLGLSLKSKVVELWDRRFLLYTPQETEEEDLDRNEGDGERSASKDYDSEAAKAELRLEDDREKAEVARCAQGFYVDLDSHFMVSTLGVESREAAGKAPLDPNARDHRLCDTKNCKNLKITYTSNDGRSGNDCTSCYTARHAAKLAVVGCSREGCSRTRSNQRSHHCSVDCFVAVASPKEIEARRCTGGCQKIVLVGTGRMCRNCAGKKKTNLAGQAGRKVQIKR